MVLGKGYISMELWSEKCQKTKTKNQHHTQTGLYPFPILTSSWDSLTKCIRFDCNSVSRHGTPWSNSDFSGTLERSKVAENECFWWSESPCKFSGTEMEEWWCSFWLIMMVLLKPLKNKTKQKPALKFDAPHPNRFTYRYNEHHLNNNKSSLSSPTPLSTAL